MKKLNFFFLDIVRRELWESLNLRADKRNGNGVLVFICGKRGRKGAAISGKEDSRERDGKR